MHSYGGWCEGIICWEDERAPVLAVMVRGIWRAGKDIMPSADVSISCNLLGEGWRGNVLQNVGLGGVSGDEWRGICGNGLVFPGQLSLC